MNITTIKIDIDFDVKFWAIIPAINLNFHNSSVEFEWLCLGIYFNHNKTIITRSNGLCVHEIIIEEISKFK